MAHVCAQEDCEGCEFGVAEGDTCTDCGKGTLRFVPNGDCFCHLSPPCSACVESVLECDKCGTQP
jgi:hypothetical protein